MILTCAPHVPYSHMKFDDNEPAILSRESFYKYYCEFHKFPFLIDDTGFKLIRFLTVFKYLLACSDEAVIKCFPSFPDGIPLLTADSQLRIFSDPPRVLCSKYSHIFQKSASMFLNPWFIHRNHTCQLLTLFQSYPIVL